MDEPVADLKCIAVESDGRRFALTVSIGRPYQSGTEPETWSCPVVIDPLHTHLRHIAGGDALQSLCLACRMAFDLLLNFVERGGRLVDEDGNDVPLDAYGFLPK